MLSIDQENSFKGVASPNGWSWSPSSHHTGLLFFNLFMNPTKCHKSPPLKKTPAEMSEVQLQESRPGAELDSEPSAFLCSGLREPSLGPAHISN